MELTHIVIVLVLLSAVPVIEVVAAGGDDIWRKMIARIGQLERTP
jgi:hypothetical protein